MNSTQRFIVENQGEDQQAVRVLIGTAAAYALKQGLTRLTLVVPTKGQFPHSIIAHYLGAQATRALSKGQSVDIVTGLSLALETPRNLKHNGGYGLVMATYLSRSDMGLLDSTAAVAAIAYLPWTEEDGKNWMATWQPTPWGPCSWVVKPWVLPGEVEDELQRLTRVINLSTGLANANDKDLAIRVLRSLRASGFQLEGERVRSWAIKHGWVARHADELARLSERYCT
ncbi:hypothetical protein [Pseudomonas sp. nanlin1]|uniref:hypothetical protein n=1 Tax=Pseudomonas sp. nanlin1 TaxID=3040605 RepID=UPI00388EC4C8